MTTSQQQSVNTNLSADQQGTDVNANVNNFDTSEADAILGGVDVVPQQPTQQTEQQPQQNQGITLSPETIAQLRAQIQQPNQTQQQVPTQQIQQVEQQQTESPIYSDSYTAANAKFKESTGLEFGQAIDEYMMATVGMPLKETIQTVQQMSSYINQRQQTDQIEIATQELRSEWGNNYDAYMQIAREEYDKLPQQTKEQFQFKSSLNNAQGAKLLLAQALQSRGMNQQQIPVQYNPFVNTPSPVSSVTNGNQPQLRLSQILGMSDSQYNSPEVRQALQLGAGRGYIDDMNMMQQTQQQQGIPYYQQQVVNGVAANPSSLMLG